MRKRREADEINFLGQVRLTITHIVTPEVTEYVDCDSKKIFINYTSLSLYFFSPWHATSDIHDVIIIGLDLKKCAST